MTSTEPDARRSSAARAIPVFLLSDSTAISAATMGDARVRQRCFGIVTTPAPLSQVHNERRPDSRYASLQHCLYELRQAEAMFKVHRIPMINSSANSVEGMSTVILQTVPKSS
jgi:regulator of PEP synthase PpsR (kinase-PPPase family)